MLKSTALHALGPPTSMTATQQPATKMKAKQTQGANNDIDQAANATGAGAG